MRRTDWVEIVPSTSGTKVLTQTDGAPPTWEDVESVDAVSATLTVSGATELNGGLTMDTNKFTVADTTGNTVIDGTLTVAGAAALNAGITVDTTAFIVANTTGDVTTAGTLTVAGAAALDGGITVDTSAFIVANTSGNVTTTGTLTVGGAAALDGGISVDTTAFTVANTSGNTAIAGTLGVTGVTTPTGGIAAGGGFTFSPRLCHTGGVPAQISTEGTDLTVVVTELYVAEVFIPANCTVTGVAVLWGSATEGNAKVMLFNSSGTRVAISASTDVSAYTADSYGTNIAFTGTYAAKGPATYYVGVIADNTGNRINTHILGAFGAGKITGLVYATEAGYASITVPTTFTTGLGPIASLY